MNVLVLCNLGKIRSVFLAQMLHETGLTTRARGIYEDAHVIVTDEDLNWADKVVVVDEFLLTELSNKFRERETFPVACVMPLYSDIDWAEDQLKLRKQINEHIDTKGADMWCIESTLGQY